MRERTKRNGLVETHRGFGAKDSMPCPVQRACRAYLEAHAAVVALDQPRPDMVALAAARNHRESALRVVRSLRARSKPAVRAKIEVFLMMVEWYGPEEPLIGEFAVEVLREAAPFFLPDAGEEAEFLLNGSAASESRHQWFDRLPRLLWFAHDQKEEDRRSQN